MYSHRLFRCGRRGRRLHGTRIIINRYREGERRRERAIQRQFVSKGGYQKANDEEEKLTINNQDGQNADLSRTPDIITYALNERNAKETNKIWYDKQMDHTTGTATAPRFCCYYGRHLARGVKPHYLPNISSNANGQIKIGC